LSIMIGFLKSGDTSFGVSHILKSLSKVFNATAANEYDMLHGEVLLISFLELSFMYRKFFPLLESFFTFPKLFFFFFEFGASHVGMHLLDLNIKFSRF
jgi:hypothetical protein